MSQKALEILPHVLGSMHADIVELKSLVDARISGVHRGIGEMHLDVSGDIAKVGTRLTRIESTLDRLARLLEGTQTKPGVISRLEALEKLEEARGNGLA